MTNRGVVVLVGTALLTVPLAGEITAPATEPGHRAAPTADRVSPASRCFPSTDNGDPVLTGLETSRQRAVARGGRRTVTFTVTAEDTGGPGPASGVTGGTVYVGLHPHVDAASQRVSRTRLRPDGHGRLVATWTVGPWHHRRTATRYLLVEIHDAGGNEGSYTHRDLARMGLPGTLTTRHRRDVQAPVVWAVGLSATTVDTRLQAASVTVSVSAIDDGGVAEVRARLAAPRGRTLARSGPLTPVTGTPTNGQWQGQLRVGSWQGTQTANLHVTIRDHVHNLRSYGPTKLAALGQPGQVGIVSSADLRRPRLSAPSVTPAKVDVSAGAQTVTLRFRVTDRGAGVRRVGVAFRGPNGGLSASRSDVRIARVSGSRRDGTWQATLTLPPCAEPGPWRATMHASDLSGRRTVVLRPAFTVVNTDVVRPTARIVGDAYAVPQGGALTVRFDEDVVGVDAANAAVYVGAGDDGPQVAGAWACLAATGHQVDCVSGPVRTAAFIPGTPWLPGRGHTLVLNREHHLGLTDLAGNPYDRRSALLYFEPV